MVTLYPYKDKVQWQHKKGGNLCFPGIWERKSWQKLHKRENIRAVLCPPPLFLGDILNHILLLGKLKIKNVGREGEIKLIPL